MLERRRERRGENPNRTMELVVVDFGSSGFENETQTESSKSCFGHSGLLCGCLFPSALRALLHRGRCGESWRTNFSSIRASIYSHTAAWFGVAAAHVPPPSVSFADRTLKSAISLQGPGFSGVLEIKNQRVPGMLSPRIRGKVRVRFGGVCVCK